MGLGLPVPVAGSLMAHYTSEGPFNKSGSNIVKWEDHQVITDTLLHIEVAN